MQRASWGEPPRAALQGAALLLLAALTALTSGPVRAQMKWPGAAPRYGTGRLWAPAPARATVAVGTRAAGNTSAMQEAVRGMVAAANDSAAREEAARPPALPVWKGTVAGAEFGLDSKWMTLAGFKVPSAVLALLPVSGGSPSPEAWEDARLLADRRADIERAAAFASYRDARKAAVADIRARKEFERSLNAAQRRLPAHPARDTTPP